MNKLSKILNLFGVESEMNQVKPEQETKQKMSQVDEQKMKEVSSKLGRIGTGRYLFLKSGKMTCFKCGKKVGCRPDVYQKRIERVGDEKLLQYYTCSQCRSEIQ